MGKIGEPFPYTVPAVGTSSASDWAEDINDILTELIDRVDSDVESSSININADLECNNNRLTEVNSVVFNETTPISPSVGTLYVDADGELHAVTADGDVQLTTGGSVNSAGGGTISGDTAEAVITYTDASERFTFSDSSSASLATIRARYLELSNNASGSNFATLQFSGNADVTYSLPDAAPGTTSFMVMDSSGNITVSNSLTNSLTLTGNLTAADIDFTAERLRTSYISSRNLLTSNSLTTVAGSYSHTAGSSSTLTAAGYSVNANGDWFIVDVNDLLDDGDIITGWVVPFEVTGSMTSATIRVSVGVADAAGSFSVPGSLSESVAWTYSTQYDDVAYTGVSTVTVDRNGTGSGSDIVRAYYLVVEVTAWSGTGTLVFRTAQLKVKRA